MKKLLAVAAVTAVALGVVARARSQAVTNRTHTIKVTGRERSYRLHVPAKGAGSPRPLVLVFHGGASNPQPMERLTGFNAVADREGFLVAYPAGTGRLPQMLTWNAGACCGYAVTERVDDVAFVRALIDELVRTERVDPSRVYATGISNGGQMAHRLAVELPDRIAAVAPVAASLEVPADRVKSPLPVMMFHGTNDENLPFAGGRGQRSIAGVAFTSVDFAVRTWTRVNGCSSSPAVEKIPDKIDDGTSVEVRRYKGCQQGFDVVLYVIHGGGHTWPGNPLGERRLGVATREISATALMWSFFRTNPQRPKGF